MPSINNRRDGHPVAGLTRTDDPAPVRPSVIHSWRTLTRHHTPKICHHTPVRYHTGTVAAAAAANSSSSHRTMARRRPTTTAPRLDRTARAVDTRCRSGATTSSPSWLSVSRGRSGGRSRTGLVCGNRFRRLITRRHLLLHPRAPVVVRSRFLRLAGR